MFLSLFLSFSSDPSESTIVAAGGGQVSSIWISVCVAIELIFAKDDGFSLSDAGGTTVALTSIEVERLRKGSVVDWNDETPQGIRDNLDGFLGLGYWYSTTLSREIYAMAEVVWEIIKQDTRSNR